MIIYVNIKRKSKQIIYYTDNYSSNVILILYFLKEIIYLFIIQD